MFEFIADDDLRSSLERDSEELKKCAEAGAWKAVHVIAGSIVEALLVDQIRAVPEIAQPPSLGDPLKASLSELIDACQHLGILSERTVHLTEVIRSYRNLIHPGRSCRLGDVPTPESAQVAQALVGMVMKEVGRASERLRGMTADQLVLKIGSDSSASDILTRLLDEMNPVEIEKLVLSSLPIAYLDTHDEWSPNPADYEILRTCFQRAFERATPQAKAKVCASYVRMIREDTQLRLSTYEYAFFRAEHLEFIPEERDRALVKEHLLGLVKRRPEHAKITLAGMGTWLTSKECVSVARDAIHLQPSDSAAARSILREVYTGEAKPEIARLLKEWIAQYEKHNRTERVKMLQELLDSLEGEDYDFDDIPF